MPGTATQPIARGLTPIASAQIASLEI